MSDLSHLHAPPSAWHQALNAPWLRRLAVLVLLAAIWEVAAIIQNNPIMLPRFTAVVAALWQSVLHDGLLASAWVSIEVPLKGYMIAVALALLLVGLAAANGFALRVDTRGYRLEQANEALDDLRAGRLQGAGVILPSPAESPTFRRSSS